MHEEHLWRIVSTDGSTVLEELNLQRCEEEELAVDEICDVDSDSRNAGVHTWEMLIEKIGGVSEIREDDFGDMMLREWATGALSFTTTSVIADGRGVSYLIDDVEVANGDEIDSNTSFDITRYDPANEMTASQLTQPLVSEGNVIGTLIRGSSETRSPFLLSDQAYHKSLVLILCDDNDVSAGVIL